MNAPSISDLIIIFSAVLAAVPVALCYSARWWLDRGSLVPPWLFPVLFVAGAGGGLLLGIYGYEDILRGFEAIWGAPVPGDSLLAVAVVVPAAEELGKAFILLPFVLTPWFRGPVDGLIYGFAAGAGFACAENFVHFASAYALAGEGSWLWEVVTRSAPAAIVHAGATASVGAFIGAARFDGRPQAAASALVCGVICALLIHGIWNWLVTTGAMTGDRRFDQAAVLLLPVVFGLGLAAFSAALRVEARALAPVLVREVEAGIVRSEELAAVIDRRLRRGDDWLAPGARRSRLIGALLGLGFTLHRHRQQGRGARRAERLRAALFKARGSAA